MGEFDRWRGEWIARLLWLLPLLVAAPVPSIAQDAALGVPVISVPPADPPIKIDLGISPGNAPLSFDQKVGLTDELRSVFHDHPVKWAPDSVQQPLQPDIGMFTGLPPIRMGLDGDPNAQIAISFSRELLLPGETRTLTLTVRNPASLPAGVYRGNIVAHWECLRIAAKVKYTWPVELRVSGRHLIDVAFTELNPEVKGARLRVGDPMSVAARVLTVNCELGHGALTLSWQQLNDSSRAMSPLLALPLDLTGPLDPEIDLAAAMTNLCPHPMCPDEWHDEVLMVERTPRSPLGVSDPSITLHTIKAELPACARLGTWRAKVTWELADAESTRLQQEIMTSPVVINSGIRVIPRFPIATLDEQKVFEPVNIQILSTADLGDQVNLAIKIPGGAPISVLARRTDATAEIATARVPPFEYWMEDVYQPFAVGTHEVVLAEAASEKAREVLGSGRSFDVLLDGSTKMTDKVTLFIEGPPVHWPWFRSAHEGWGRQVIRPDALRIHGNKGRFDALHAELKAIGRVRPDSDLVEWSVAKEDLQPLPQVSFPDQTVSQKFPEPVEGEEGQGRLTVYGAGGDSPGKAAVSSLATWNHESCPDNTLALNIGVQLDAGVPPDKEPLAQHRFFLRFLVAGTGPNGLPLYRIHNEEITVEVEDAWKQYHQPALIWSSIFIASLFGACVVIRGLKRWLASPAGPVEKLSTESTDLSYATDFADETALVPGGVHEDSASGSPSVLSTAGSPPSASETSATPTDALSPSDDNEYAKTLDWMNQSSDE